MSWEKFIQSEQKAPYYQKLSAFLEEERKQYKIFPYKEKVFSAFTLTPLEEVKVVIVGQDPYHQPEQANGLAFSVESGMTLPRSLTNIFKEIEAEYGARPADGDLTFWAKQGVLLLNTVLTVRYDEPGSHQGKGWEIFTGSAIDEVEKQDRPIVYLLWGKQAQAMQNLIYNSKHLVLTSAHPSPFSARKGFFGNNHFRKANEFLTEHGETPIDWTGERT